MAGIWRDLDRAPLDPIMAANERWPAMVAAHPDAIKTTIGILVNGATGSVWRPRLIEDALVEAVDVNAVAKKYDYLPPLGLNSYREGVARLIMGDPLYEDKVENMVTAQTLGGTTTLTLASKVLARAFDQEKLGSKKPTLLYDGGWKNHEQVFGDDFQIETYDHLDANGKYNHDGLLEKISGADPATVVLLQACGYNDDGIDRTPQQWAELLNLIAAKQLPLILDTAYAGLAGRLPDDRFPILAAANRDIFTVLGISNSKNLGLYDGRVGLVAFMNVGKGTNPQYGPLEDLLKRTIRGIYSSPPRFPAEAVGEVLMDKTSRQAIAEEIGIARMDLVDRRRAFASSLNDAFPGINEGRGLFTKLFRDGFTERQFQEIEAQGILALRSSRISIGGITSANIPRVGAVISEVLEARK